MNFIIDFKKIKNFVIAEIGTNHNRSKQKAIKMINEIAKTKCDCVKFQIYEPREIVSKKVMARDYGLDKIYGNITAYEMFDKYLVTPKFWFPELKKLCHKKNLFFAVTIHGENGIKWAKKNKPDFIKIASMDHNNFPFIKKLINKLKVPILVSLGMAKIEDIIILVKLLKLHKYGFGLFHCTSLYPPKIDESRLSNISYLIDKFKIPIGFSDHFIGFDAAKNAKLYGATFFEKHVTLNPKDHGPDHKFALPIKKLKKYVQGLKKLKYHKKLKFKSKLFKPMSKREFKIRQKYTKSIIIKSNIEINSKIIKSKIYLARPGTGIEPKFYQKIINKTSNRNLHPEQVLQWNHIKK
jgi:N-acetylneuraminate synthase/N,N'-diacetyllegionaminate synthase